tara:strand:- start:417 stop:773 length:357 start_codon:yes stop_codon:yes gene_type:complete
MLSSTTFTEYYEESKGIWTLEGVFPKPIEKLNGIQVSITGYVLPLNVKERSYVLSAYPYSSCYFCGGAGPESIVGLKITDLKKIIETDAVRTFSGILELEKRPKNGFYFTLNNARLEK